jgi:eukaryotic-like serine/threonine-protein kinase
MAETGSTQLGRYRVLEELGRGAMGVVYKAEDPMLDRVVAIKTILLSSDMSEREEYEARFFQEAKAAGRLSHPCIITIHDVGREGDLAYMAMEMLEGVDLRVRMSQGRIPVPDAIDIVEQVAEGLAYAHERGVVHRDIKPANIMIVHGGRIKIMDFGIARMRISDLKTRTGMLLGTPKYMSPEQVTGRPLDSRSDIFSLGIVLHELLTNAPLFTGSDTTQVLHNVANLEASPPSRSNREVPEMLDLVVAKALAKDVDARYQDAYEFAADLRACLHELAENPPAGSADTQTVRLRAAKDPRSNRDGDTVKTVKLNADSTRTVRQPGAAATVDSTTVLPLALRFDSSAALKRLTTLSAQDRARLARSSQSQSTWLRLWRDTDQRLALAIVAAAVLIAVAIAFM